MNTVVSVASVASAAAVAAPSLANATPAKGNDPIFAVITRWLEADSKQVFDPPRNLVNQIPTEKRTWQYRISHPVPPPGCSDAPAWIAANQVCRLTQEAWCRTHVELVSTAPTTMSGLIALLDFIRVKEDEGRDPLAEWFTGEYENGEPLYLNCQAALIETVSTALSALFEHFPVATTTGRTVHTVPDDPIFAAIEAYKRAYTFHEECLDKANSDSLLGTDEGRRLARSGSATELGAIDALLSTVPTTTAGALSLIRFLLDEGEIELTTTLGASFKDCDTRAVLRSMAAFLKGVSPAPIRRGENHAVDRIIPDDPVFDAIKRHRVAFDEMERLGCEHSPFEEATVANRECERTARAERAAERRWQRSMRREDTALRALLKTRPKSHAGAAAQIRYVRAYLKRESDWVLQDAPAISMMLGNLERLLAAV